jgi:lipoprotein-releasing system permease protein
MSIQNLLATRYLFSRGKGTLVWVITGVSVGGVAIGVAALVVVLSVMEGLNKELFERLLGAQADAIVYPWGEEFPITTPLIEQLERNVKGVVAATPVVSEQVLMQSNPGVRSRKRGVELRGLDMERDQRVTQLTTGTVAGVSDPGEGVVLGLRLAEALDVGLGDDVMVVTTRVRLMGTGYRPERFNLKVNGFFKSGIHEVDQAVAYVNIEKARSMFKMEPDSASDIRVKMADPQRMEGFEEEARKALLPFPTIPYPWTKINPTFFAAIELEKYAMFVILMLIVVVASFNIIGTLVLVVSSKTREIGLLQAIGVSPRMITGVFVRTGLILGALGTAIGCSLGLAICGVIKWKRFEIPEQAYQIDHLPAVVRWDYMGLIVGCSMLVCLLASIVPARRAAKLQPVEALRYE